MARALLLLCALAVVAVYAKENLPADGKLRIGVTVCPACPLSAPVHPFPAG